MKIYYYLLIAVLYPGLAFAHEADKKSVWENLFVAFFPILLIVFVFWLFMRSMNKGGKSINERLLESNLEIAKELKRIADHVEKNS